MIERPERHVEEFAKAGADGITIHVESTPNIAFTLSAIRDLGLNAGLVVSPGTPPDHFGENEIDLALIMTVNPGWGGQPFLTNQLDKIKRVRAMLGDGDADRGRRRREPGDGGRSAPRPARRGSSRARRSSAPTIRRRRTARSRPRRAADERRGAFRYVSGPCGRFAERFSWPSACCSRPRRPRRRGRASPSIPKAGPVLQLSGGQISAIADLPARTYTLPRRQRAARQEGDAARALDRGPRRPLRAGRAARAGRQQPRRLRSCVTPAQFGSAFLSDDGTTTRFIRSSGGIVSEFTEDSAVPLEVSVDGGDLAIKATGEPQARQGRGVGDVRGQRALRGAGRGLQLSSGTSARARCNGKRVSYSPDLAGHAVRAGRGPRPGPGLHDALRRHRAGRRSRSARPPSSPRTRPRAAPNGTPGGAGSSGGTGGGGSRRQRRRQRDRRRPGHGRRAIPAPRASPSPSPSPSPSRRRPSRSARRSPACSSTTPARPPASCPAASPPAPTEGVRAVRGGDTPGTLPLGLGGLLALAVMWVGSASRAPRRQTARRMIAVTGIEELLFELANVLRIPVFVAAIGALAFVLFDLGAFFVELSRRRRRAAASTCRRRDERAPGARGQRPPAAQQALMPLASSAQMADTLSTLVDGHDQPGIQTAARRRWRTSTSARCASSSAAACSCASARRSG